MPQRQRPPNTRPRHRLLSAFSLNTPRPTDHAVPPTEHRSVQRVEDCAKMQRGSFGPIRARGACGGCGTHAGDLRMRRREIAGRATGFWESGNPGSQGGIGAREEVGVSYVSGRGVCMLVNRRRVRARELFESSAATLSLRRPCSSDMWARPGWHSVAAVYIITLRRPCEAGSWFLGLREATSKSRTHGRLWRRREKGGRDGGQSGSTAHDEGFERNAE